MSWLFGLTILITPWTFFYVLWRIKFKRSSHSTIPVLAYHQVSDRLSPSITRQKVSQFERGMSFIRDQGYSVVSIKEILNSNGNHGEGKVAITFDDANQDTYLNAFPLLQKFGFTACIFVITGYVGKLNEWDYNWLGNKRRHLNWEEIKEMADAGFEFGSHTVNHPDLTRIPTQFVEYELKRSKEVLEDKLGRRIDFLSYPFGRYNRYVQEEAERIGYQGAYTLNPNPKEDGLRPFSLSRLGVYLLDSPLTLKIKLNQDKLFWIEDMKGRIINRFPGWTVILKGSPNYGKIYPKPCIA